MTYLLDTNACIAVMRNLNQNLSTRVLAQPSGTIAVCTIVEAELYLGAYRSARMQQNLPLVRQFVRQFPNISFDQQAADIAGQVGATLAGQGTPIGPYDLLIAAIAIAHNLTLVTHNVREFGRVNGLSFEDWESAS
jgi:tRNA(fMet)-specific endonuclease VapC